MKTNIIIAILFLTTVNLSSQTYNPNSQDVNRIVNTKKTTSTPAEVQNTDRFYFENEAGEINPAFIALADLGEDFIISTGQKQDGWSMNQKDKNSKAATSTGQVDSNKIVSFQQSLLALHYGFGKKETRIIPVPFLSDK